LTGRSTCSNLILRCRLLLRPKSFFLAAPPILPGTTILAFQRLAVCLGPARGYLVGFLFYWIGWCFLLPLLTLGPHGLREMLRVLQPTFGKPGSLRLFLLLGPLLVVFSTRFWAELKGVE
jgi:hypothetical protein